MNCKYYAGILIIKVSQREMYPNEISQLLNNQAVKKSSSLNSLSPFIDSEGLLRVGGRLKYADISNTKKPVIHNNKYLHHLFYTIYDSHGFNS